MSQAKALRHIPELCGKSYAPGDAIPAAVIAKITPQVLRVLVDQHTVEVEGMEATGSGSGGLAHLTARLDQQGEQTKKLLEGFKLLEARVIFLEGGKPAAATTEKKAPVVGRKAARAGAAKEK